MLFFVSESHWRFSVAMLGRSIYLGESFCSYISVGNHTNHDVRDVGIKASAALCHALRGFATKWLQASPNGVLAAIAWKNREVFQACVADQQFLQAELQTERQRVTLADSTKAPMDYIRAGGRHDFIIEHDIKELGPHT